MISPKTLQQHGIPCTKAVQHSAVTKSFLFLAVIGSKVEFFFYFNFKGPNSGLKNSLFLDIFESAVWALKVEIKEKFYF